MITVSVIYAAKNRQKEIILSVEENCTVALAIARSKIQTHFPEIQLANIAVGIFSKRVTLDAPLKEGDRIEIYRLLVIDPKELRRLKARK
ncbi:MAG: RnfH family protein [Coxiellaceae bacterium]|nr:RnfH family protein [Coxiellaceae bacterium]